MFIKSTSYVAENDDTADTPTKVFAEQSMTCRNPKCTNNGLIVYVDRTEIPLSTAQVEDINSQE